MRAAVLERPGAPLQIEEIPVPAPKAGEILVQVAACGVCHTDLHVIKGEVAFPTPCVLGHEISGNVAALGAGVDGPAPGTPVVCAFVMPCGTCRFCAQGRDDLCDSFFGMNRLKGTLYDGQTRLFRGDGSPLWMYSMGGLAEYAVVPATDVFPLPSGVPVHEAAILGCAVFTAYGAVRNSADLRVGESVAVIAVGGVGMNLVQVARAFGASQIVAVDLQDAKLDMARQLGATDTVNAAREDAVARVRELTGGRGVDVSFEALGRPETFIQASEVLCDGGRMVAIGIAPGTTTAPLEITRLVRRSQRVIGSYGARTRTDMPAVLKLAAAGALSPVGAISRHCALDDVTQAYRDLSEGKMVGRAIVQIR
ncbi:MAG: zinc-binding dehydrogenase [Chloroflexota bacterium]|nr:zinc-binding dehydrogenase [Chloroflexota bacterium]